MTCSHGMLVSTKTLSESRWRNQQEGRESALALDNNSVLARWTCNGDSVRVEVEWVETQSASEWSRTVKSRKEKNLRFVLQESGRCPHSYNHGLWPGVCHLWWGVPCVHRRLNPFRGSLFAGGFSTLSALLMIRSLGSPLGSYVVMLYPSTRLGSRFQVQRCYKQC